MKEDILEKLRSYKKTGGQFHPFNYAIGISTNLEDVLEKIDDYPFSQPFREDDMDGIGKALPFLHEHAHLTQYLATAFGLRYLRLTLISLRRLSERKSLLLPVLHRLLKSENPIDLEDLNRYLAFLEATDQLRIQKNIIPENKIDSYPKLWFEPNTPMFHAIPDHEGREKFLKSAGPGLAIKKLPHLTTYTQGSYWDVPITTAVLMEAHAILVEFNHLNNALNGYLNLAELLSIIPDEPEYRCVLEFAYQFGICPNGSFLPLLLCIDLALMYDPFTLYDVSPIVKLPGQKYEDVYPGDTFIKACVAAKEIDFGGYEVAGAYYRQLCQALGVPSPAEMAKKTHEVAKRLTTNSNKASIMYDAFVMHEKILEIRLLSPDTYPVILTQQRGISDTLPIIFKGTSFYNISDKQPLLNYMKNVGLLTLHTIILQILLNEKLVCPLKHGTPLKCFSADKDDETICQWHDENKVTARCLVDVLGKLLGVTWLSVKNEEADDN